MVVSLRRYPVKGMAGEALETAEIDGRGLNWDRWYAVVDEQGRFASGKESRRFRRRDAVVTSAATASTGTSRSTAATSPGPSATASSTST